MIGWLCFAQRDLNSLWRHCTRETQREYRSANRCGVTWSNASKSIMTWADLPCCVVGCCCDVWLIGRHSLSNSCVVNFDLDWVGCNIEVIENVQFSGTTYFMHGDLFHLSNHTSGNIHSSLVSICCIITVSINSRSIPKILERCLPLTANVSWIVEKYVSSCLYLLRGCNLETNLDAPRRHYCTSFPTNQTEEDAGGDGLTMVS